MNVEGVVYLVGAGPGDPELITVRGLACLRQADVVIYDRLVHPSLLDEAPAWAERIFVGKASGRHTMRQDDINALMIERARAGQVVVRLKGGDPFVFGRGGEEMVACLKAGVRCEVVPGVTSAISVPASASIPVTYRGVASAFAVVTAHRADILDEVDWEALARVDTLVVLMGVKRLPHVVSMLRQHGRAAETPVAVVERGTLPQQRVITGTLANIVQRARQADVRPPATIVIGNVVRLREGLPHRSSDSAMTAAPRLGDRFDRNRIWSMIFQLFEDPHAYPSGCAPYGQGSLSRPRASVPERTSGTHRQELCAVEHGMPVPVSIPLNGPRKTGQHRRE